jgi:hypothetical protein
MDVNHIASYIFKRAAQQFGLAVTAEGRGSSPSLRHLR